MQARWRSRRFRVGGNGDAVADTQRVTTGRRPEEISDLRTSAVFEAPDRQEVALAGGQPDLSTTQERWLWRVPRCGQLQYARTAEVETQRATVVADGQHDRP